MCFAYFIINFDSGFTSKISAPPDYPVASGGRHHVQSDCCSVKQTARSRGKVNGPLNARKYGLRGDLFGYGVTGLGQL